MRTASVLALVSVLLLVGCGGDERREAVDDYLERVERIEQPLLASKGQLDLVLGRFSLQETAPADLALLDRAETTLRAVVRRLDDVEPPREALPLHGDLTRMLELQADVVHDLTWAARYVPRLRRAVRPLRPASEQLAADLRAARDGAATRIAFAQYRNALGDVLEALEPLQAPGPLRPSLQGQREALARGVALCREVEDALERGDASRVATAAERLVGLSSDPEAARTRDAEIAAAKAYNRRLARIAALARQVERERRKLDSEVD